MGGGGGRSDAYGGIPVAPEPSPGGFSGFDNGGRMASHDVPCLGEVLAGTPHAKTRTVPTSGFRQYVVVAHGAQHLFASCRITTC